jgi:hypothetical protein
MSELSEAARKGRVMKHFQITAEVLVLFKLCFSAEQ